MGKKLVVELTNRCNLHCDHCLSGRHGGRADLPLAVLARLLAEAQLYRFDELSFTGGEPTLHPHFAEVIAQTVVAGYRFALNTNASNFTQLYPTLLPYREQLTIITFSLDGATAATHDQLRGQGSFRRVMQAMSICTVKQLPFSINMVVTAHNRHEIGAMVALAARLGARGVRFGHLLPTAKTLAAGLDLTYDALHAVEAEIRVAASNASLPVVMASGYHTSELFPCDPLQGHEININCHGEMTLCCHLSGHDVAGQGATTGQADVVGNLAEISFGVGYMRLVAEQYHHRAAKVAHYQAGTMVDADFFPCLYCMHYYHKLNGVPRQHWPLTLVVDEAPVVAGSA